MVASPAASFKPKTKRDHMVRILGSWYAHHLDKKTEIIGISLWMVEYDITEEELIAEAARQRLGLHKSSWP